MSMSSIQKIKCPECGNNQDFEIWQSVNVSLDPHLKQKILDRSLVTFRCDRCAQETEFYYPILYHDMNKRIMIYLIPSNEENEELVKEMEHDGIFKNNYQSRIVSSLSELIEKISIFDEDLDDRIMEILKVYVDGQEFTDEVELKEAKYFFSHCEFNENDKKVMTFVSIKDGFVVEKGILIDAYKDIAKEYSSKFIHEGNAAQWLRVDRTTVRPDISNATKSNMTEILNIAKAQKGVLWCVLAYLCSFFISFAFFFISFAWLLVLPFLLSFYIYKLAKNPNIGSPIPYAISMFLPYINLLIVLYLSLKATKLIKEAGFKVGLMGAKMSQIEASL